MKKKNNNHELLSIVVCIFFVITSIMGISKLNNNSSDKHSNKISEIVNSFDSNSTSEIDSFLKIQFQYSDGDSIFIYKLKIDEPMTWKEYIEKYDDSRLSLTSLENGDYMLLFDGYNVYDENDEFVSGLGSTFVDRIYTIRRF